MLWHVSFVFPERPHLSVSPNVCCVRLGTLDGIQEKSLYGRRKAFNSVSAPSLALGLWGQLSNRFGKFWHIGGFEE